MFFSISPKIWSMNSQFSQNLITLFFILLFVILTYVISHAHSYIINYDDENVKALFTQTEWNELTEDRIRIPGVPREIGEELVRYGKKTLSELRNSVLTSYLQDGTIYDINKHYNQEWIQMAVRTLVNLYENIDAPLIRNQYENWFTVAFFGTCIDLCMRDIQLCTDIKRFNHFFHWCI